MDCLLPLLFEALSGAPVMLPDFFTEAPPQLQNAQRVQKMMPNKSIYGASFPNQRSSENFTVGWENGHGSASSADEALEALEHGWAHFVEDNNWVQPVASDEHLVWVILRNDLSGTGLTTTYSDANYPQGYPVIYLNSEWSDWSEFWETLAVHELGHALQYAHRSYTTSQEEPWYWEASAVWMEALALPGNKTYAVQASYYADQPEHRYSSMEGYHQYGMFLINTYIEEHITGEGGLKSIWELSASRSDKRWPSIISESTGQPIEEVFQGMTRELAEMNYTDSTHYEVPKREGRLEEQASGILEKYGTHYWKIREDVRVEAQGSVILSNANEDPLVASYKKGDLLAVTATANGENDYVLNVFPPTADTGDTAALDTATEPETPIGGCACNSKPSRVASLWILAGLCIPLLRRKPTVNESCR